MIEQAICRCFPRSSPTKWRRSFGVAERRARACHGALGNARAVAVRRGADHEHSERWKPALATMARAGEPVRRSGHVVLRIRGHEASQDAQVVRVERGPAAVRLCRTMDALARAARSKERAD